MIAVLLLPLSFFLLFALCFREDTKDSFRCAFIKAWLIFGLCVVLSTEVLSLINVVGRPAILTFWLSFCSISAMLCVRKHSFSNVCSALVKYRADFSISGDRRFFFVCFSILGWMLLFTFLGAFLYAPSTYDAMTYHLTRIMLWFQNNNVDYVVTDDQRLNYQLPLAEYTIMHVQALSRSDWFANLVQWSAYVMSIVTASLLASDLGLRRRWQWLTAVVLSTTPNVIYQAQSTQNDLFAASFIIIFTERMLKLGKTPSWSNVWWAGVSMGLSLYAKGTAFLYIAVLGPGIGLWILLDNKRRLWHVSGRCIAVVFIGLFLISPCFARNLAYYGSLMPQKEDTRQDYMVPKTSPKELVRSLARAASLHLGLPSERWNSGVQSFMEKMFGSKYSTSPNITNTPHARVYFALHEDCMGNFLHLSLLTIAILVSFQKWVKKRRNRIPFTEVRYTMLVFATAVFIFASLAYSPWRARYHVPLFCLASVSIAAMVPDKRKRYFSSQLFLAAACFVFALPILHLHSIKPLTPAFFRSLDICSLIKQKNEHFPDEKLADDILDLRQFLEKRGISDIMLLRVPDQRDYPLYKLLGSPLQDSGVSIHRVLEKDVESEGIPWLLVFRKAHFSDTFPLFNYNVLYRRNSLILYDITSQARFAPEFAFSDGFDHYRCISGFSSIEKTGIWSLDNGAVIDIIIPADFLGKETDLVFDAWPFLCKDLMERDATFLVGEREAACMHYSVGHPIERIRIHLLSEETAEGRIHLTILHPGSISPKSAGISSDVRNLGLHFRKAMFECRSEN